MQSKDYIKNKTKYAFSHYFWKLNTTKQEESNFSTRDGTNIFYQIWRPEQTPKGIIQIIHGLAEHSGRYMHVVNKLVPEGYTVYGYHDKRK
ncbi:MAG: alpha/beta hydrolase [Candidatus Hodarchaeales archaeon]